VQFLPKRLPVIILQRVEEQFPALMKIVAIAICLCADKRIVSSYSEDFLAQKTKCFLGILSFYFWWSEIVRIISCILRLIKNFIPLVT
jgi:hypothetical protein